MKSKHHTRAGYEQLYRNICKQAKLDCPADLSNYSHMELMMFINYTLQLINCIQFTVDDVINIVSAFK